MNIVSLLNNLNEVKSFLKSLDLLKSENLSRPRTLNPNKFSKKFWEICIDTDTLYHEVYQLAMENGDYDFILIDDSILQFSCDNYNYHTNIGRIRYAYYQNPRIYPTYDEFLITNGLIPVECGDMFYEDYNQYIFEADLSKKITTVRYDYNYKDYNPPYHPISHLHIGHNNDVRIAIKRVLFPIKFTSFVVRNVYINKWQNVYTQNAIFKDSILSKKNNCLILETTVFNEDEGKFLHII